MTSISIYKSQLNVKSIHAVSIADIFDAYYSRMKKILDSHKAIEWLENDNNKIYIFDSPTSSIDACVRLTEDLVDFNQEINIIGSPLYTRIGIQGLSDNEKQVLEAIPAAKRKDFSDTSIDKVKNLERSCPLGKIKISSRIYNSLSMIKKDMFRPTSLINDSLDSFVLRRRSIMPQEESELAGLTHEQKMSLPPMLFLEWKAICPEKDSKVPR